MGLGRSLVVFYNIILTIFGFGLSVVGFYGVSSSEENWWEMSDLSVAMGVIGAFSFAFGLIYISATVSQKRYWLKFQGYTMALLAPALITVGAYAIDATRDRLRIMAFSAQLWKDLADIFRNSIQNTYGCCGYLNPMMMRGSYCPANPAVLQGCAGYVHEITYKLLLSMGIISISMGSLGTLTMLYTCRSVNRLTKVKREKRPPVMNQL